MTAASQYQDTAPPSRGVNKNSLRTLHIMTRHLGTGGSERDVEALTSWEISQGDEVHLALGFFVPVGARLHPNVKVHYIPHLGRRPNPLADIRALRSLRRLIRSTAYDVVHTHQSKAGVLGRLAARRSEATIVHTIHMASFGQGYSGLSSATYRLAERVCGHITDHFGCVSEDLADAYVAAHIADRGRFSIVRTPVDLSPFLAARQLSQDDRARAREAVNVPLGSHLLIAAGLLEPRKRYDLMLRSLATLLQGTDTVLLIAGGGPDRAALHHLAEKLQIAHAIRLPGVVVGLERVLATADVLVHTARAEGLPRVMVEALAAGVPIVATEVSGVPELMRIAGKRVTMLPFQANGLAEACWTFCNSAPPEPIPSADLEIWSPSAVQQDYADMRSHVLAIRQARRRRGGPLPPRRMGRSCGMAAVAEGNPRERS